MSPDGGDSADSQRATHFHREGQEGIKGMEDKRPTHPQTGPPSGEQRAREPLKLLRGNPRVRALLSSLVSAGGSTNWR